MKSSMPKCKITVIKRALNKDLIEEFISDKYADIKACDIFKDGQEVIIDPNLAKGPMDFVIGLRHIYEKI